MTFVRNTIQNFEDGKGMCVSFPCEIDGNVDYLLLDNIKNVVLRPVDVNVFDINTCNIKEESVSFSVDCEEENAIVVIAPAVKEFYGPSVNMEMQQFVDDLARSIYENKRIEKVSTVSELKTKAVEGMAQLHFEEEGVIQINQAYNTVGRVIDKNGKVLMVINSFTVNRNDDETHFSLNDCVSYITLGNMESPTIEFYTGKVRFAIDKFEIVKGTEGLLKHYVVNVKNASVEQNLKDKIAETVLDIENIDNFFDMRTALLSEREEIFKENNNPTEGLFDDFDF